MEHNMVKPGHNGSKFQNPWKPWPIGYIEGVKRMSKWLYSIATSPFDLTGLEENLPIKIPYFKNGKTDQISDKDLEYQSIIRATWLGHASVCVEIDGFFILCDPVFDERCPPPFGPKRFRKAPCDVDDLPNIDAILLSHNHYDHMDAKTINKLSKRYPKVEWLIPMNDKSNLLGMLAKPTMNITEMMWWDKKTLTKDKLNKSITIHFTPTQHWSNRGAFDSFKSLWGSWAIIGEEHKFWFGGDTGYCPVFKDIGKIFGYFDVAAIPIGAFEPRDLTEFQHVNPEKAVEIHKEIKSKVSFGIHWGTFRLTSESYMEPKKRLMEAIKNSDIHFRTIAHGDTLVFENNSFKIMSEGGEAVKVDTIRDQPITNSGE